MNRKTYLNLFLGCGLLISLMMSLVVSASAQAPAPTPVPTAIPQSTLQPTDPNVVTFAMLGRNEMQLIGPYSSTSFSFPLPSTWKLISGNKLNLAMAVSFSTVGQSQISSVPSTNSLTAAGATFSVFFNNVLLGVAQLNQLGEVQESFQIPDIALASSQAGEFMGIRFVLDSRSACNFGQQVIVVIHSSSQFYMPHESIVPSTDLVNFPQPIFQGTFVPDSAVVVIPDQPTSTDLQDAMTIAAGLGNLSSNRLLLDLTTLSQLTPDQKLANHIVFVGKGTSLPILGQLNLPVAFDKGAFQFAGSKQDDGLIELVDSPWNANHVVLVVSGNTDQGVSKAAQAVTSGRLLSDLYPNVSVVQDILATPETATQPVDQTLTEMGYSQTLFTSLGVEIATYQFNIPPGWALAPDARFNLVFGNSALLNYDRSGIVVSVNNVPVGSVRLSDATAAQATNTVGISIPSSVVVPGRNILTVNVNLVPVDSCSPPNLQGLWAEIWPNSNFHLPLDQPSLANPASIPGLSTYPAPFTYDPTLASTALVLPHNDLASWRAALQMAAFLGQNANGTLNAMSVFYSDQVSAANRANYNFLVIGLPSQLPMLDQMNASLPVPFTNGNNLSTVNNLQVTYRVSPNSPLGYIELMTSPWNPNHVVLTALGNTPQGLGWATTALIDPTLRSTLAGNFDVVNNRQILTIDTRQSPIITATNIPTLQPGVIAALPSTNGGSPTSKTPSRPGWILPLIIIAVILIIVILVIVVVQNQMHKRLRKPHKEN